MLDEINKTGTTVILVTHQRDFISKMPRRVVVLEDGKVIFDEDLTLAEACKNPDSPKACENEIPEFEKEIPEYESEDSPVIQQELPIDEEAEDGFVPPEINKITEEENL
jgi:ABC-type methionine transport system ATPase subunit